MILRPTCSHSQKAPSVWKHHIDTSDLRGIDSLRRLLDENQMNASDLARLLGVHASMGSKML
jgi:hypothetical protein